MRLLPLKKLLLPELAFLLLLLLAAAAADACFALHGDAAISA
jgi:hypothetical protein